jgi:argininosuccinate synthase
MKNVDDVAQKFWMDCSDAEGNMCVTIEELRQEFVKALVGYASESDAEFRTNYPNNLAFARNEGLEAGAKAAEQCDCGDVCGCSTLIAQKIRALKDNP